MQSAVFVWLFRDKEPPALLGGEKLIEEKSLQ